MIKALCCVQKIGFILVSMAFLTPLALAEGISSATPDSLKNLQIPDQADIVVSGGTGRGEWAFIMGPLHDKETQKLRLIRPAERDGKGVVFQCDRKTGDMEMALSMPDVKFKVGEPQDVALKIGSVMQFVKMEVTDTPPKGRPAVFVAKGAAIPSILRAMGTVSISNVDARMSFGMQKKFAAFDLPRPREIPKTSALLCASWGSGRTSSLQK